MKQCLSVIFSMEFPKDFFQKTVLKHAQKLGLEGTAQRLDEQQGKIIVCGSRDAIDEFIDLFHLDIKNKEIESLEIEPFLKEKDYRGVFRVIE